MEVIQVLNDGKVASTFETVNNSTSSTMQQTLCATVGNNSQIAPLSQKTINSIKNPDSLPVVKTFEANNDIVAGGII